MITKSFYDAPNESQIKDKTVILDPQAGIEEKEKKNKCCLGKGKSKKDKKK